MNLTTRYMGLTLKNPIVASASPLSQSVDTIRRLEDHGASAVVMFSLFEEQIRHDMDALDHFMSVGRDSFGEALSYFPVVVDQPPSGRRSISSSSGRRVRRWTSPSSRA